MTKRSFYKVPEPTLASGPSTSHLTTHLMPNRHPRRLRPPMPLPLSLWRTTTPTRSCIPPPCATTFSFYTQLASARPLKHGSWRFQRPIPHLARLDHCQRSPLLAQIGGHCQRSPGSATQEPPLHQAHHRCRHPSRFQPTPESEATNIVFAAVVDYDTAKHLIHSDLTGRFPLQSSRGMNYVLVVYDYDSNAILAEPMRNRTDAEMLRATASSFSASLLADSSPNCTVSTTKHPLHSRLSSRTTWILRTNSCRPTSIVAMPLSALFGRSKIISLLASLRISQDYPPTSEDYATS
jgi:hypothetical protein